MRTSRGAAAAALGLSAVVLAACTSAPTAQSTLTSPTSPAAAVPAPSASASASVEASSPDFVAPSQAAPSSSAPSESASATDASMPPEDFAETAEPLPSESTPAEDTSTPDTSTSDSATPSRTTKPAPDYTPDDRPAVDVPQTPIGMSPLNGKPITSINPVLIMKLDNTTYAQPHAGLTKADVVYLEEVEYGITRIAAVFSSQVPHRIGPIRSARITDVDLVAQYGRPAFGYSGAQRRMWPVLAKASIYDVSPYKQYDGYSRDNSRRAPYNLYFDGTVGERHAPKASKAKDMGFVFDAKVPDGGYTATKASMRWGYGSADFAYDKKSGLYDVSLNGRRARAEESAKGQRAATVVIQYVKQTKSPFYDKGGGNTPHAETIGKGNAIVMRDGVAYKATWSRPNAKSGTTFTLADGSNIAFKPGQLWIVLLDKKRTATVTPMKKRPLPAKPTAAPAPPSPTPAPPSTEPPAVAATPSTEPTAAVAAPSASGG